MPRIERPLRAVLRSKASAFCRRCTLHGCWRLAHGGRASRALWAGVMLGGLTLCATLGNMIWTKFRDDPTFTVVESAHFPTEDVEFPAVAVCDLSVHGPSTANVTNILSLRGFNSSLIELFYDSLWSVRSADRASEPELTRMHTVLDDLHISHRDLLYQLRKPCRSLVVDCSWEQAEDCSRFFRDVFTAHGYCCQFDLVQYLEMADGNETELPKVEALDIIVDSRRHFPNGSIGDGQVTIFVVNPEHSPTLMDSGVTLEPSTLFDLTLDLWIIDASEDFKSLSLESRGCYLPTDGMDFNSYQSCISHLMLRHVVAACVCLPFDYAPHGESATYPRCKWPQLSCVFDTLESVQSEVRAASAHECFQQCEGVQYETRVGFTRPYRLPLASRLQRSEEWGLSRVSLRYADNSCFKYRREVLYTWDQLLANLGGIFGLCLGGSIISVIEILLFLLDLLATCLDRRWRVAEQRRASSQKAAWAAQRKRTNGRPPFPYLD